MIISTIAQADGIQLSLYPLQQQLVKNLLTVFFSKLMKEHPQGTIAQANGVQEHFLIL